ncbi:MAG: GntR family transcriptional regulator [Clostridiales bacterium]|jgi:K+/H+ antiporter YhaU regulatory subunit KhtT|nr:GntR family transcriptional regulator [Clostridiales bacterium]
MKRRTVAPIYSQIAFDIASKIARGELREGERISGRSLTASQYSVSPETVRRSFRLLADMEILDIQKNSGAIVLSKSNAVQYIEKFETKKDIGLLKEQLKELLKEREKINNRIVEVINEIIDISERFRNSDPLRSYEFRIAPDSPLIGKTIANSKFWQNTGGTIVAIRRGSRIILSPGPYAEFLCDDTIIVSGEIDVSERVETFINP